MKATLIVPLLLFHVLFLNSSKAQVQRNVVGGGQSKIRENIKEHMEFHFMRDWSKSAVFKSGIGESVELFPIVFNLPNGSNFLYGIQLDAEVKPRNNQMVNSLSGTRIRNNGFVKRSIFIDKEDVARMISYMDRDIIPHLKDTYKEKSKEYVFKSREMFFSFLIDERDVRITIHILDFGPLGDGTGGGDQIEFWTEAKVDEIPKFLSNVKSIYATMK